ncbi:MAG: hypothetical protein H6696_12195 [Deferribacteres bacterium]|nr:hypothetical protein [candidate division KSB1 bacterium]MCB9502688.1 hypothetical protein [Deferribacteres bacterium]
MIKLFVLTVLLILTGCSQQKETEEQLKNSEIYMKISVLQSGSILLNGKESTLEQVEQELIELKARKGSVWYYREVGQEEPPNEAMEVIKLIAENDLPITLSSRPDFSDYIDENGQSHTRE